MDRLTRLDDVWNRVWDQLVGAAEQPGHPLRTLTFGTATDNTPHLRTVVLRHTDPEAHELAFHSDRRAQKIEDIRSNDRVAWHGWAPETSEQIRLHGRASVHLDDSMADALWNAETPGSLAVYLRDTPPGTPIDAPGDGKEAAATGDPVTRDDVEAGRPYFAVVRTVIDEVEWLHLHPEGHYRARFQGGPDADVAEGTWIVP